MSIQLSMSLGLIVSGASAMDCNSLNCYMEVFGQFPVAIFIADGEMEGADENGVLQLAKFFYFLTPYLEASHFCGSSAAF
jgi:hypothetical protein